MKKTSTSLAQRAIALTLAAMLAGSAIAQEPEKAQPAGTEQVQPKFIWGVVIPILTDIVLKPVITAFGNWLMDKLTEKLTDSAMDKMKVSSKSAEIVPLASASPSAPSTQAGAGENTVVGTPDAVLKVENGRENYQAVHIALIGFDHAGKALGFRPVNSGFRTGERFKLRVLPTFDGLLVIENINPLGRRGQIYPALSSEVLSVKAAQEILVPVKPDQYFEFTGTTGNEQLVVTLRDPRAFGAAASPEKVFRKDENNGSNFVQEVKPGTYPLIAQSIHLQHERVGRQ